MDIKQKIKEKFFEIYRFIRFVVEHFIADDCTYRASALAFTTLLAVVPLMAVGFAILTSFPVFQHLSGPLQDFIFENFVPATGTIIQTYLVQFTAQVTKLSLWGVVFLFVTAILVMYTIESSMNKIWRAPAARQGVAAFLLYWAILSLAPVLLGLSLAVSSYIISMPLFQAYHGPTFLLNMVPFLLSLAGFIFLYVVVPNRPVRFIHGFWGGLVAALLFELAKQTFAYYLSQYHTYELLYGAFATIPIFFVWVYWMWLIILVGAEISYALSVHYKRRPGNALEGFCHALLWLHRLWIAQREGESLTLSDLINATKRPFVIDPDEMINQLCQLQLIQTTSQERYILSRDLNYLSLYSLKQLLPYSLPGDCEFTDEEVPLAAKWQVYIKKAHDHLEKTLSANLEEVFADKQSTKA